MKDKPLVETILDLRKWLIRNHVDPASCKISFDLPPEEAVDLLMIFDTAMFQPRSIPAGNRIMICGIAIEIGSQMEVPVDRSKLPEICGG